MYACACNCERSTGLALQVSMSRLRTCTALPSNSKQAASCPQVKWVPMCPLLRRETLSRNFWRANGAIFPRPSLPFVMVFLFASPPHRVLVVPGVRRKSHALSASRVQSGGGGPALLPDPDKIHPLCSCVRHAGTVVQPIVICGCICC